MVQYFKPGDNQSMIDFTKALQELVVKHSEKKEEIVLLCIGSDRATGDCLGPIIGHKLYPYQSHGRTKNFHIHAKNLEATLQMIQLYHTNALVIAIDASLGIVEHIGYVTLGEGSLSPGIGVAKNLPAVGDIFITGIVNLSGFGSQMLLQTTHLNLVMKLADFITMGLYRSVIRSELRPALQRAE